MEGFIFFEDTDEFELIKKGPCVDCQSVEWTSCNTNESGDFCQCNVCHKWDEKEQKLVRVLHS